VDLGHLVNLVRLVVGLVHRKSESTRVSALGIELITVDPLIPANRGVLMDHRLDLGVSKADSGVSKVV